MDTSTTSIKSTGSTGSLHRPAPGATRQLSNVSAQSCSTTSPAGSPRVKRRTSATASSVSSGRSTISAPRQAGTPAKPLRKTSDHNLSGTPGRLHPERSGQDVAKAVNGSQPSGDSKSSANSANKAKVSSVGNRRPDRTKANGTPTARTAVTPGRAPAGVDSARKTSTPKERSGRTAEGGAPTKPLRDFNRNINREKPIRSDSSDIEAASKLVSAKVYELRSQLANNNLVTAPLKEFLGRNCIESIVVLPIGRFSKNSKSLWRAAMLELLLEIAVPKRRIFLDPTLIDLEKESLRSHAFLHRGDPNIPEDIEMLENSVRAPGSTLVYAPSPDAAAVEAIIEAYEERNRLSQLFIIGYSLHKLAETGGVTSAGDQPGPGGSQTLKRLISSVEEETFPFDLFPQSAFAPVFAELRGHRFKDSEPPAARLSKSSSRNGQEMRASSCETLLTERSVGSDEEAVGSSETSAVLKAASSAPNLASPPASKVPTALLTVGAICCGAGLAWMFMSKR